MIQPFFVMPSQRVARMPMTGSAEQSIPPRKRMDCCVAKAPLRKRFAFVAGNDGATLQGLFQRATQSIPRRAERRRVGKRLLTAHQLRQQAPRRGAERVTLMTMPEMHPQAPVLRSRSNNRQHVGHARADPAPGFGLDGCAEVDKSPRGLLGPLELARVH